MNVIYFACKNYTEATKISRELVENREAFCVNIIPQIHSIYPWKGKVEEADEVLVLAKTKSKLITKVMERIKRLHSYELPEIISLRIERTTKEVEKWLKEEFR